MTQREADFLPQKINQSVPNMTYDAAVVHNGPYLANLGAPVAPDADGILDGTSIATAGSTTTFAPTYSHTSMAKYGRAVVVVANGTATSTVTVKGRDYLGQPMAETLTLNGTTPVPGKKAFKFVESVEWAATASRTIDVGWNDVLGLPFATREHGVELEDGVVATAGTFVTQATATATATTGDVRGTYDPNSACDGSKVFEVGLYTDRSKLHGVPQYYPSS